jgi:glycosyltransferase involved in cell wall biosynthesis
MNTAVIIPAYNEELSIGRVVSSIPRNFINEVIVINNNSIDNTAQKAMDEGATVLLETFQGYGASCLKGIEYLKDKNIDIIIFMDGDYSDHAEELNLLIDPIREGKYDFVIGSRILGKREKGALPLQSRIGSIISGFLIKLFWGFKYTDLGPFRAIKFDKLLQLNMKDKWFGWTVEMQIKALKNKLRVKEVPVSYRKRIGNSKVTGTVKGSIMAGIIILKTIFYEFFNKQ